MSFGQFQFRRDTAANWTSANPTLLAGEFGLETDTLAVKLGDGATAWASLGYYSTKIRTGSGVPAGGLGVVGDLYIRSSNGDLYLKTAVSTWTVQGNLTGPVSTTPGPPGVVQTVAYPDGTLAAATGNTAADVKIKRAPITGEVGVPDGSNVATIANDAVTYAKMQNVAANNRALGRVSGAGGDPEELTPTQVTASLVEDASFTLPGRLIAREKIALNSLDGRTSAGATPRVFRPGDYMVGNTYDPTGSSNSTSSFSAMVTAIRAHNDRFIIELAPGVFKLDHDVLRNFGTNNPSGAIIGSGRGCCILLPSAAPTGDQAMVAFNRGQTGSDAFTMRGFTIYNTSGTVYTAGSGILTNGADGIDISEVACIDLYRDFQVSGEPHTMTTAGTTALTGVSPVFVAADVGQVVTGPGIVPGTTLNAQAGATGTLSAAATNSTSEKRFLNNSIKVSMQKIVSFNTNAGAANTSVGIYVNNGQAGDTYIGPDIVMSDGGGTTRRRANVELVETGHYEITQCNLTGSQTGVLIDPAISQVVGFGFTQQMLCDSNSVNGMNLNAVAGSTIKNIKSVNCWYSGTTVVNGSAAGAGVITQGAGTINGITHTTDRMLNNRTHGYDYGAGTDFRFSDCDMKGNSQVGSGTAHGLNVAANIGNWSINGGKYGGTDTAPTGSNQGYGIMVAAGTGDNIKISPDSLTGNATGPLSFGATGASNFINGCPGLPTTYFRGAPSASITNIITVANILIPKNSQRIGTTYRGKVAYQHSGAGTAPTFTVGYGATNDAVGSAGTNAQAGGIVGATGAASVYGEFEFICTISALGAGTGNINTYAYGMQAQVVTNQPTLARTSGTHFLAIDTTADRYLTLRATVGVAGLIVYHASIEVVNY